MPATERESALSVVRGYLGLGVEHLLTGLDHVLFVIGLVLLVASWRSLVATITSFEIAERLDANPDSFLMGVAVAASCAFLTPIGHKNNTLIMGPGGYQFGDYWRMGLPLEVLIVLVSVPMILLVWPL